MSAAAKITPAQTHALRLLEIQDAKRGWAHFWALEGTGVRIGTLRSLVRRKLVEMRHAGGGVAGPRSHTQWRLTAQGEKIAADLKRKETP